MGSSYIICSVCPKKMHYKDAFLPDGRRVGGSNFELGFGNQIGANDTLWSGVVNAVQGDLPPVFCSLDCLNKSKGIAAGSAQVQPTKVVRVRTGPTKQEIEAQTIADREKREAEAKEEILRVHQEKMSVIQDDVIPENPKDLKDNFLILYSPELVSMNKWKR